MGSKSGPKNNMPIMPIMPIIEDAYISLELETQPLEPIRECLQASLRAAGIRPETPEHGAHVSISYTMGAGYHDTLEKVIDNIATHRIELRVRAVEVLEGLTTPFDYVTLTLEESDEFKRAKSTVESNFRTKRFHGGFKVHVTLLRVSKGTLSAAKSRTLEKRLCRAARRWCGCTKVAGSQLAVYDNQKRCRIQRPLPLAS